MGCVRGGKELVPGDKCIFRINFSGMIQVLLRSSQPLASANYYQLGRRKTTKKAFYFAPVGLSPPTRST